MLSFFLISPLLNMLPPPPPLHSGHPDPVHNCSAFNLSVSMVNIRCVAGFDGGLPQKFLLQLRYHGQKRVLANLTSEVSE